MFNPLSAPELIVGMGRTMRAAAGDGADDDWARGQLLSAYSISRLLAAEVDGEAELLAWLKGALGAALAAADGAEAAAAAARIEAAADAGAVGDALVELLATLRERPDPPLRARLHAVLREMTARELATLAASRGVAGGRAGGGSR